MLALHSYGATVYYIFHVDWSPLHLHKHRHHYLLLLHRFVFCLPPFGRLKPFTLSLLLQLPRFLYLHHFQLLTSILACLLPPSFNTVGPYSSSSALTFTTSNYSPPSNPASFLLASLPLVVLDAPKWVVSKRALRLVVLCRVCVHKPDAP